MGYQRYLDIHLGQEFTRATFERDVKPQRDHQVDVKKSEYRHIIVDEISVSRNVTLEELQKGIAWVCAADGEKGGKLRINSHGSARGVLSTNARGSGTSAEAFAAYLVRHGLNAAAMGEPGLKTINLACCYAASGPQKDWTIKKFADALKLPGVKVTGADAVTKMRDGVLFVEFEAYVPPIGPAKYVPPHLRTPTTQLARAKGSQLKKSYVYTA